MNTQLTDEQMKIKSFGEKWNKEQTKEKPKSAQQILEEIGVED